MSTSLSNTTNFEFVTDNCNGNTLAQGATCTVSLRAKATFPGESEGAISGTFNVTADNNVSVPISGYKAAGGTRIFVTSSNYSGNLGGIGGAHTICQTEAGNLGYSGYWRALLSNAQINAKDLLTITYPVVRATDGTTVDAANIWDGSLTTAVTTSNVNAWTGTGTNGIKWESLAGSATTNSYYYCYNWRNGSTGARAQYGFPDSTSGSWVSYDGTTCNATHRLYCVEQAAPLGAQLTINPASSSTISVFGTGSPAYGSAVTRERQSLERWVTRNAVAARRMSEQLREDFANAVGGPRKFAQGADGGDGDAFADRLDEAAGAASSFNAGDLSAHFNKKAERESPLGEAEGNQMPQSNGDEQPVQPDYEIVVDEEALTGWKERSNRLKGPEQSHQPGKGYGLRRDPGKDGGPDKGA